jgi:hypothetical protein
MKDQDLTKTLISKGWEKYKPRQLSKGDTALVNGKFAVHHINGVWSLLTGYFEFGTQVVVLLSAPDINDFLSHPIGFGRMNVFDFLGLEMKNYK